MSRQGPNEQTVMAKSEASGKSALESVAVRLRQSRIGRELSLEELSNRLSISRPHLERIESGDFSFLAPPYIFAYLKEYCQELELCDDALLEECRKELAVSSGPPRTQPVTDAAGRPVRRFSLPFRFSRVAATMAVIALLLAILLLGRSLFAASAPSSHGQPGPTADSASVETVPADR